MTPRKYLQDENFAFVGGLMRLIMLHLYGEHQSGWLDCVVLEGSEK